MIEAMALMATGGLLVLLGVIICANIINRGTPLPILRKKVQYGD